MPTQSSRCLSKKNNREVTHTKDELIWAYREISTYDYHLEVRGLKPKLHQHQLNNETSRKVKHFKMAQQGLYHYAPSDQHCANNAKQFIQTFKGIFKYGFAIFLDSSPMLNWSKLCPQADFATNIARL